MLENEDFHDFRLERFLFDSLKRELSLVLVSEADERVSLLFKSIAELQIVDLAFESVIDEIKQIPINELAEYGDFESRYKWSIYEAIAKFQDRGKYRLWIVGSSFGLQGAIYAEDLTVTPAS